MLILPSKNIHSDDIKGIEITPVSVFFDWKYGQKSSKAQKLKI